MFLTSLFSTIGVVIIVTFPQWRSICVKFEKIEVINSYTTNFAHSLWTAMCYEFY
jgi:hypothetical protein